MVKVVLARLSKSGRRLPGGLRAADLAPHFAPLRAIGDAEGRYYTGDTIRRVHEGEHTLNLNHPRSMDALAGGLERALRRIFADGRGAGGTAVNVDLRGAFFPDRRSVEKLFDLLDDYGRGRRSYGD